MSKEVNKQAQELVKRFYQAIDKKVTPALFKVGIGQFKNLLNVYTFEELEKVINYIREGNEPNAYSPGYLSYATNKILDKIALKEAKEIESQKLLTINKLEINLGEQKKDNKSKFMDRFM